ncbi:sialidase family protein [Paenibacillus cymbidii]|uniref:sialidase family protein n=1 Tax=Paenibacillus cymbidii TaxID=1639034 RepID=UPI00108136C2|nr:sialidase family protein [Paenibacillus cymbidii]
MTVMVPPRYEFIFGDERPFASCHASTVLPLPDGSVLAAWFGGTEEGAGDVAIWCAIRKDGGWSKPVNVTGEQHLPHFNPVLFGRQDGGIVLVYKTGWDIPDWISMVVVSEDGGHTWSAARQLVEGDDSGGRGPVKNKPIVGADGTLLAPASIERGNWDAFVDRSRDGGVTWAKSARVPLHRKQLQRRGVIQPTLWESAPGNVHMLLRSTEGSIFRSDSHDGGLTWGTAYATALPNNNSGIDLVRLDDGRLLLAYNPVAADWGPRTPLVIDVSRDNGAGWERLHVLEADEAGEFSYPAIVASGSGVHVTYTWNRQRIVYRRFTC